MSHERIPDEVAEKIASLDFDKLEAELAPTNQLYIATKKAIERQAFDRLQQRHHDLLEVSGMLAVTRRIMRAWDGGYVNGHEWVMKPDVRASIVLAVEDHARVPHVRLTSGADQSQYPVAAEHAGTLQPYEGFTDAQFDLSYRMVSELQARRASDLPGMTDDFAGLD